MAPLRRSSIVGAIVTALLLGGVTVAPARARIARVAVFPVENLSEGTVPADDVRHVLIDRLTSAGVTVLGDAELDEFVTRHRVRYTAGIDTTTAERLARETGVDAVVIPSFELLSVTAPPKVALVARLVSVQGPPTVVWADDAGLAGDDAPGLFGLGAVNDSEKLLTRALTRVADSLVAYIETGQANDRADSASKFRPKTWYRQLDVQPGTTYSVAVVPFVNLSDRRNAGEILASLFMRHLAHVEQFRVIDTGVVREQLLNARIIMEGGLSVADAETVAALIDADFVLGGRVLRYDDYEGAGGLATVEFSAVMIDRKKRRVVWSSESRNDGNDGVRFFERGISRTAHFMATQMVRFTTDILAGSRQP